ncbi:methyl-accepting chemotaxis protein [Gracilibacillus halophilus YIM-C55.5]|uniref:Methyl-accepting chemotaxis protein n=1 Tax=Gracilibacillus halophilus YIM-C55.5 TaxID=1308866 RepID=N4WYC0_9BACI|nr:methyl-accepting chemotaxis protein [Gracilibacillus halophilus]ENH98041.1 methyl-accepting chemotaxis protein [Gracilibacillus halophilus YIM-C55.5]
MKFQWNPKKWWQVIKQQKGLLRTKLMVAFLAILIIPSTIIGYFSYVTAKDEVHNQISNGAKSSLTLVESNTEQFINMATKNLNVLTDSLSMYSIPDDEVDITSLMDYYVTSNEDILSTTVALQDGTYVGTPTNDEETFDPTEANWYTNATETDGDVAISNVVQSHSTNKWAVRLSKPLPNQQGVVQLTVNLAPLAQAVQTTQLGDTGTMAILDNNGNIVTGTGFIFDSGEIQQGDNFAIASGEPTEDGEVRVSEVQITMPTELYETTESTTGWTITGLIALDDYNVAAAPILKIVLIVLAISAVLGVLLLIATLRTVLVPIRELGESVRNVRDGHLNEQVEVKRHDEVGQLAEDFNEMTGSLRTVVKEVKESSSVLTSTSKSIKESTDETTKSVEEVVNTIQETAETASSGAEATEKTSEAVNEMATGMQSITDSVQVIADTVNQAEQNVGHGSQTVTNVREQMNQIQGAVQESSDMIQQLSDLSNEAIKMNSAIGDIAEQTNLLSLNASIEAARSGEYGKGFAVVANEILKLSDQSKEVADGINETIKKMIHIVDKTTETMQGNVHHQLSQGMKISEEADEAFESIENSTTQIVEQVQEISSISEQISAGTKQVTDNVNELEKVTKLAADSAHTTSASAEEQMAAMEEINSVTQQLSDMANNLEDLVKKFSL